TVPAAGLDQAVIAIEVEPLPARHAAAAKPVTGEVRTRWPDMRVQSQGPDVLHVARVRPRVTALPTPGIGERIEGCDAVKGPGLTRFDVESVDLNFDPAAREESVEVQTEMLLETRDEVAEDVI